MRQIAGLAASPLDKGQVAGQYVIQFVDQRLHFGREVSPQCGLSSLTQPGEFITQAVQRAQSDHDLGDRGNRQSTGEQGKRQKQGSGKSGNGFGQQVFIRCDNQAGRFAGKFFRAQDSLNHQQGFAVGAGQSVFVFFSVSGTVSRYGQDEIP